MHRFDSPSFSHKNGHSDSIQPNLQLAKNRQKETFGKLSNRPYVIQFLRIIANFLVTKARENSNAKGQIFVVVYFLKRAKI